MKLSVPMFLDDETIAHLDLIARRLSKHRQVTVGRSDAVAWLVKKHRKNKKKKPLAGKGVAIRV